MITVSGSELPYRQILLALLLTAILLGATSLAGSFPLQQATAQSAAWLISLVTDVQRNGTVLILDGLEVAVTEDCAGINALSVLTPIIMLWSLVNRVNIVLMAIVILPVTLLANTVRVLAITSLALAGDISLAMGELHTLSGLLTFAIAMGISMAVGRLSLRVDVGSKDLLIRLGAASCFLMVVGRSLFVYAASPLDARLLWLMVAGIILLVLTLYQYRLRQTLDIASPLQLVLCLHVSVAGYLMAVQLIWMSGLLVAGLTLLAGMGVRFPRLITLACCFFPSLPGLIQFPVFLDPGDATWVLYAMSACGLVLSRYLPDRCPGPAGRISIVIGSAVLPVLVCLSLLSLSSPYQNNPGHQSDSIESKLPYAISNWVGRDIPLLLAEETLFRGAQLAKREYRSGRDAVSVLEISSASRQHLHPPQYCYASAGWSLNTLPGPEGLSLFLAQHGENEQLVGYYVELDGKIYAGSQLLKLKIMSLLSPGAGHWRLIRLATVNDKLAVDRLLEFRGLLEG